MVTQYGMGETLGPAVVDTRPVNPFLGEAGIAVRGECSEETARQIDAEVRRLLKDAEDRVRVTLESARGQLEALAQMLLEHETVERETLLGLLVAGAPLQAQPGRGT
jgi:cell division protease FtsH